MPGTTLGLIALRAFGTGGMLYGAMLQESVPPALMLQPSPQPSLPQASCLLVVPSQTQCVTAPYMCHPKHQL